MWNFQQGIPPVSNKLKASDAWVTALCKKLATWWPWVSNFQLSTFNCVVRIFIEFEICTAYYRLLKVSYH